MRRIPQRLPLPLRRLARQVGFRGYVLFTLALVCGFYGWSLIDPQDAARSAQSAYIAHAVPIDGVHTTMVIWAIAWWVTCAFCAVNAFRTEDRWGYGAVTSLMFAWAVTNLLAACDGMPNGWSRAVVWGWVASMVFAISFWPEPRLTLSQLNDRAENRAAAGPPAAETEEGDDA